MLRTVKLMTNFVISLADCWERVQMERTEAIKHPITHFVRNGDPENCIPTPQKYIFVGTPVSTVSRGSFWTKK